MFKYGIPISLLGINVLPSLSNFLIPLTTSCLVNCSNSLPVASVIASDNSVPFLGLARDNKLSVGTWFIRVLMSVIARLFVGADTSLYFNNC